MLDSSGSASSVVVGGSNTASGSHFGFGIRALGFRFLGFRVKGLGSRGIHGLKVHGYIMV